MQSLAPSSPTNPPPPALSSPAGSWTGEGAESGAEAGSWLRGSRKRRKRWGGWGAGAWAIVPFSLERKLEEKQKTESSPPGAFGGIPFRLWQGVGVPGWLAPEVRLRGGKCPLLQMSGMGGVADRHPLAPSCPDKNLDSTESWCSAPSRSLVHGQLRPEGSKYPRSPLQGLHRPLQ